MIPVLSLSVNPVSGLAHPQFFLIPSGPGGLFLKVAAAKQNRGWARVSRKLILISRRSIVLGFLNLSIPFWKGLSDKPI
jgi:hypothetical protein